MNKSDLILIGGGGHCKSCIDVIEMLDTYNIIGIIDLSENIGNNVLGYPIIGSDKDIERFNSTNLSFFITLGQIRDFSRRKCIFEKLVSINARIPAIVSPLAYVSKYSKVNIGSIVMHQAIINASTTVGINCIINTKALLEHDVQVGNYCHISTGSVVNGGVKVGDGTFYGSTSVSKESIEIPAGSFIKANSIVK